MSESCFSFHAEDLHVAFDIRARAAYDRVAHVKILESVAFFRNGLRRFARRGIIRCRGDIDLLDTVPEAVLKVFFRQPRAAMKNERGLERGMDLLQAVDAQVRLLLVVPVRRANGDGKRIHAGLFREALRFRDIRDGDVVYITQKIQSGLFAGG